MEDKALTCKDCKTQFAFTVRDQEFYAEKGFENEPQRCRDCRSQRKTSRSHTGHAREMFDATCANCGIPTKVPFEPRGDRPVYCRKCFTAMATQPAAT